MNCTPPDPNDLSVSSQGSFSGSFIRASARFVQTVTRTPLALYVMFQGSVPGTPVRPTQSQMEPPPKRKRMEAEKCTFFVISSAPVRFVVDRCRQLPIVADSIRLVGFDLLPTATDLMFVANLCSVVIATYWCKGQDNISALISSAQNPLLCAKW